MALDMHIAAAIDEDVEGDIQVGQEFPVDFLQGVGVDEDVEPGLVVEVVIGFLFPCAIDEDYSSIDGVSILPGPILQGRLWQWSPSAGKWVPSIAHLHSDTYTAFVQAQTQGWSPVRNRWHITDAEAPDPTPPELQ